MDMIGKDPDLTGNALEAGFKKSTKAVDPSGTVFTRDTKPEIGEQIEMANNSFKEIDFNSFKLPVSPVSVKKTDSHSSSNAGMKQSSEQLEGKELAQSKQISDKSNIQSQPREKEKHTHKSEYISVEYNYNEGQSKIIMKKRIFTESAPYPVGEEVERSYTFSRDAPKGSGGCCVFYELRPDLEGTKEKGLRVARFKDRKDKKSQEMANKVLLEGKAKLDRILTNEKGEIVKQEGIVKPVKIVGMTAEGERSKAMAITSLYKKGDLANLRNLPRNRTELIRFGKQLANALDHIHNIKETAHRDLKFENILRDEEGNFAVHDWDGAVEKANPTAPIYSNYTSSSSDLKKEKQLKKQLEDLVRKGTKDPAAFQKLIDKLRELDKKQDIYAAGIIFGILANPRFEDHIWISMFSKGGTKWGNLKPRDVDKRFDIFRLTPAEKKAFATFIALLTSSDRSKRPSPSEIKEFFVKLEQKDFK